MITGLIDKTAGPIAGGPRYRGLAVCQPPLYVTLDGDRAWRRAKLCVCVRLSPPSIAPRPTLPRPWYRHLLAY